MRAARKGFKRCLAAHKRAFWDQGNTFTVVEILRSKFTPALILNFHIQITTRRVHVAKANKVP